MASSRAYCVASRQWRSKNMTSTFFRSMYNKTIIRFRFCDIQVFVKVISLSIRLRLITLTQPWLLLMVLDVPSNSNTFGGKRVMCRGSKFTNPLGRTKLTQNFGSHVIRSCSLRPWISTSLPGSLFSVSQDLPTIHKTYRVVKICNRGGNKKYGTPRQAVPRGFAALCWSLRLVPWIQTSLNFWNKSLQLVAQTLRVNCPWD